MMRHFRYLFIAGCLSPILALRANAGIAPMSWNAVTTYTDGSSAAGNLGGYIIYSSTTSFYRNGVWISTTQAAADNTVQQNISSGAATSYGLTLSAQTTYYVRVAAFDTSGGQSSFNVDSNNSDVQLSTFIASALSAVIAPSSPTVWISSPSNGAAVGGDVALVAVASSAVGIAWVQFKLDGNNLGGPITSPPFTLTWNASSASVGTHALTSVAADSAGNIATSTPVVVTVMAPVSANAAASVIRSYAYPNPAVRQNPTLRMFLGLIDTIDLTIFDTAGTAVQSANLSGMTPGIMNGQYYYDYTWIGPKASGIYYAVIRGKASNGSVIKTKTAFAVIQ